MGFNYAKERAKFNRQWVELRRQYEQLGMSADSIQQIYDFDWDCFKSQRRYDSHRVDLSEEVAVETIRQASTRTSPGDVPASFGSDPSQWLDEIEDEQLLRILVKLSPDDLTLLTCLAFEEYTQSEIAQKMAVNQATISRRFSKIQKNFKNHA